MLMSKSKRWVEQDEGEDGWEKVCVRGVGEKTERGCLYKRKIEREKEGFVCAFACVWGIERVCVCVCMCERERERERKGERDRVLMDSQINLNVRHTVRKTAKMQKKKTF